VEEGEGGEIVAEYQQRMKDWQRMCDSMQGGIRKCDNCPLLKVLCQYKPNEKVDFAEAEQIIEKWVEEHPEPVYPSVAKYLEQFGIIIRRDGSLQADFFKANEPMSAYMANLLGISPEEGENEKAD
jgi:hypothetical protein